MSEEVKRGLERRKCPRTDVRLPLQFYEGHGVRRLAVGATLNVSPLGLLAEYGQMSFGAEGEIVRVHVGLPTEPWPEADGLFQGRLLRVEDGSPLRCAVEVVGTPPPSLLAPELVGAHPSIQDLKRQLLDIADYDVNVLLRGESGTGKDVAAVVIHRYSDRSHCPFIRVNCPSIPDTLLESQLFGHEKGAFTDAKYARPGLFRMAEKGTLVLDEISAIPSFVQAKLLQAIDEKRFLPVGGRQTVSVDVRLMATTNDNLEKKIREGTFREDLFYRLNEVELMVPPLRERASDIPLLADHFLRKYCAEFRKQYRPLEGHTTETFRNYTWPGNVRELENTIKRGILMGQFSTPDQQRAANRRSVSTSARGGHASASANSRPMIDVREQAEREALIQALETVGHDRTQAAAQLGVSYRTLLRRLKKYDVEV